MNVLRIVGSFIADFVILTANPLGSAQQAKDTLAEKLKAKIDLEKGLDPNTRFLDALDFLSIVSN